MKPKVGDAMCAHGIPCTITRVYPFGTCDVLSTCGRFAWRITLQHSNTRKPKP